MTGFLLTAKQKLMLCINKRLYWPDRRHRAHRHREHRPDWPDRAHRSHWPNRRHRIHRYREHRPDWPGGAHRSHRPDRRHRVHRYREHRPDWPNGAHRSHRPNRCHRAYRPCPGQHICILRYLRAAVYRRHPNRSRHRHGGSHRTDCSLTTDANHACSWILLDILPCIRHSGQRRVYANHPLLQRSRSASVRGLFSHRNRQFLRHRLQRFDR